MSTITEQQKQHLESVSTRATRLAGNLREEAGTLLAQREFPDDMISSREYPGRLRRGIERGASRLQNAAAALDAASQGAAAIAAGRVPTAFGPRDVAEGGSVNRPRAKKICVLYPDAKVHVERLRHRVSDSERHRSFIGAIQRDLEQAGPHRGVKETSAALTEAIKSLREFEYYLGYLHDHALQVVAAIISSQGGPGKKVKMPPLKMRPRHPINVKGPGGGASATGGGVKGVPAGKWPGNGADRQKIACWLARSAAAAGLPPTLPVVCALVESNLSNVDHGDRDSIGLFQIRIGIHPAPPGFGSASGKLQSAAWWNAHPDAQMAWFAREAKSHKPAGVGADAGADGVGRWAVATERPAAEYAGRYRERYSEAAKLVKACGSGSGGSGNAHGPLVIPKGSSVNAAALKFAETELKNHVHEIGSSNTGPKVSAYLKAAGTSPGQPWCAAFVHWCLVKAGFKFPNTGGWAACSTYLAEAGKPHGAFFKVGHSEAKPGDLIVFGGDHIAMVESNHNGVLTVVGGNQSYPGTGGGVTRVTHPVSATNYTIVRPRTQS